MSSFPDVSSKREKSMATGLQLCIPTLRTVSN